MLQAAKLEGLSHLRPLKLKHQVLDIELHNLVFAREDFGVVLVKSSLCPYFTLLEQYIPLYVLTL